MPSILIAGERVDYRVVRHARVRGMRLAVDAGGVRVTLARGTPAKMAEAALRANGEWVLDAVAKARAATVPAPKVGDRLPVLDGHRTVGGPDGIPVDPGYALGPQLEYWFRAEAREHFGRLVAEWAPRMDVAPRRVVVRGQRSRWGSASTRGEISLNWRLMMAPTRIGEYVVIHELAHLQVMNHSADFWRIVARHCPDHAERRRWLRDWREGFELFSGHDL